MAKELSRLADEEFFEFCQSHPDLQIERTAEGEALIMPPADGETGNRSAALITFLTSWAWQDDTGETFDSPIRSPSDSLNTFQDKMKEYIAHGALLGWLIDPEHKRDIYRPHQPVEILDNPVSVSGDPVLPGFVLPLQRIWKPNF